MRLLIRSHTRAVLVVALLALDSLALLAQRPYANTDVGRPLRTGDALPDSPGEFELRLPGGRVDHPDLGADQRRLDPAVSFGITARTSLELGASFVWLAPGSSPRAGLTGLELGLFHLVAKESGNRPALGVGIDAFVPAGPLRSGGVWHHLRAVATRTRGHTRLHLNSSVGTYRVDIVDVGATCRASSLLIKLGLTCTGSAPPVLPGGPCASVDAPTAVSMSIVSAHCALARAAFVLDTTIVVPAVIRPRSGVRWFSGLAVDFDLTRWSTLLMADVVVSRLVGLQPVPDWSVELGARRQLTNRTVLDAGLGRRFTGARPGWSFAGGLTWSVGNSHAGTGH